MTSEIIHSIILTATIALSFFLTRSDLFQYEFQITAGIFVIYFLAKKIAKIKAGNLSLLDSVVFTLIISNIINSTGGYSSPLFFLNYFLLFALSLLIEPIVAVSVASSLLIFYIFNLPETQSFQTLIPLFSLPFLTPFALFLGHEYQKNLEQKKKIKILEKSLVEEKSKEQELQKILTELEQEIDHEQT